MGRFKSFDKELEKIVSKAIAESVEEISRQMEQRFGDGSPSSPVDWWNPDPDDPFWMLEVRQGFDNAGSWLKNEHTFLTTRDPTKAIRFPSRWAAECTRRRLYPVSDEFEPTDHLWMDRTQPSKGSKS